MPKFSETQSVINLYLFEMQCADEIGYYKLSDDLSTKLLKVASLNHRNIEKKIEKKFPEIKDISFSNSQKKFIISVDNGFLNSNKRDIKQLVSPYPVSFRYSKRDIDYLMSAAPINPEEEALNSLNNKFPGTNYIDYDDFDSEPTDTDLRFTEEFPADEISDDPESLDQLLLQQVREDLKKRFGI